MQGMKTGALLQYACEAGAILASAGPDDRATLAKFGNLIGFAFQISDDLLDIEGTTDGVGKQTGKDAAAGKATLVELMGVDAARRVLRDTERQALEVLAPFGSRGDVLRAAAKFVTTRNR